MGFMQIELTRKGALYSCDCAKCGATMYTHEWADFDHNERRDAMGNGTLCCGECSGRADPDTFRQVSKHSYAARYSAPGYLDCTEWQYGANKRALRRELRSLYGE